MWSNMYSSGPKCFQDVLQCSGPTCTPVVQNAFKMYYSAEVQHVLQWSKMLSRCNKVQWSNMYPSDPKCFQDVLRFSGPRCTTVQWSKMYYSAVVLDILQCSGPRCTQCSGPRCTTVQWSKMYYSAVVQDVLHC